MSQNQAELQDELKSKGEPTHVEKGSGALLRWFLIAFVVFLLLGSYAVSQRTSEHKALAPYT